MKYEACGRVSSDNEFVYVYCIVYSVCTVRVYVYVFDIIRNIRVICSTYSIFMQFVSALLLCKAIVGVFVENAKYDHVELENITRNLIRPKKKKVELSKALFRIKIPLTPLFTF